MFDGACGIGTLFGAMPAAMSGRSRVVGAEVDSLSSRIAAKLYPRAQIERVELQASGLAGRNQFGLVMSILPLGAASTANDEFRVKLTNQNYCIDRSLSSLMPGGCAVVVTSTATMDRQPEERAFLAEKAELIGAIRFPGGVFGNDIGAADILFLRKPDGLVRVGETWTSTLPVEVEGAEARGN